MTIPVFLNGFKIHKIVDDIILSPRTIGTTMNNVVSGMDAITVTNSGTEYKVKLEYPEGLYDNLNDLMNVEMSTPYGYSCHPRWPAC